MIWQALALDPGCVAALCKIVNKQATKASSSGLFGGLSCPIVDFGTRAPGWRRLLLSLRNLPCAGSVFLLLACGVRLCLFLRRLLARGFR